MENLTIFIYIIVSGRFHGYVNPTQSTCIPTVYINGNESTGPLF